MNKLTKILWAVKTGEQDWQEQIISTNKESFVKAKAWAISKGFNRFRVSSFDETKLPDFTSTLN